MELVRTEGPRGLWKGNSATVIRVAPYSGIQLATFDILANLFRQARAIRHGDSMRHASLNHTERLVSGAAAGTASTLVTYPLDMLRARLALTSLHSSQFGLLAAAREVVAARGWTGLYRGLGPSLVGIVPYAAVSFWTNDFLKQRIRDRAGREPKVTERLACGAVAGLLGQASCYPLDVVRRRMQTEDLHPAREAVQSGASGRAAEPARRGVAQVVREVLQENGWRGLYKGLSMNVFKGPIAVSVSFTIYSLLKDSLGVRDHGEDPRKRR